MKAKLNLTIDHSLLGRVKRYAASKEMNVSELVENYFKRLTRPSNQKNIIDLIEQLHKPSIPAGKDLKKAFYGERAKKHGLHNCRFFKELR